MDRLHHTMNLKLNLDQWATSIKRKNWIFEDICSTSASNNLILLLNDIFPEKFHKKILGFGKNTLPSGFHFLYNNQPNVNIGKDGYDNYQAPMIKNEQVYKRRMWVKGNLEIHKAPILNEYLKCTERIHTVKTIGNSTFVNIKREFDSLQTHNLTESRTLIYKNDLYQPSTTQYKMLQFDDSLSIQVNTNDLMRYSCLTYNCHKIHFDKQYSQEVENLPEIIVQGPFMVTLLLYWFQVTHSNFEIKRFSYKNMEPWFVNDKVTLGCVKRNDSFLLQIVNQEKGKTYIEGTVS